MDPWGPKWNSGGVFSPPDFFFASPHGGLIGAVDRRVHLSQQARCYSPACLGKLLLTSDEMVLYYKCAVL